MDLIANGNLYFGNQVGKANKIFLANFLQSKIGIAQLNRYAKGVVI
jgi:hypothetical protein